MHAKLYNISPRSLKYSNYFSFSDGMEHANQNSKAHKMSLIPKEL